MLLAFGELNLHACTIEFECKVASISNALLIYHIRIQRRRHGDKGSNSRTTRCPLAGILGRNIPLLINTTPFTENMYWFFTFAENPDIDTRPAAVDDDDDDTGACKKLPM